MASSRTISVNKSIQALKERGGDRKHWWLHPDANDAFKFLMEQDTDKDGTALINRLLVEEWARVKAKLKRDSE